MDWLRCNRCYRAMLNAARTFSMTQCGHVYCSLCLRQMGEKCPECGSFGFQLMPLTKPPKLEATISYFSPLEDFMELISKAAYFQENQLTIAVRGFQQVEKKYLGLKIAYSKTMSQIKELKAVCRKLHEEGKKMQRARETQVQSDLNVPAKTDVNMTNGRGHYQEQQNRCTRGLPTSQYASNIQRASGSSAQYRKVPGNLEKPTAAAYNKTPKTNTPKYPYNPNPAFASVAYHSAGTATDSGRSSMAANSADRVGVFLVPSIQRVPKSAATAKRKTPTAVRMSVPMSENDF